MKTIRRIVAVLLACVMVMSSFTITFAKSGSSSNNSTRYYNHIGIAVVTEDGKYSLKEKPSVWYYNGDEKVKISLNNMYLSGKNGKEYQSSSRWSFTNNTKFYVEAVLTDGKNDRVFRADVVNTSNYRNSGLSFYEYCAKNYCDDKKGIDMKLIVEELVETTKYTVTYSDGGVEVEVPVDNNLYLTGDKVTVADDVMSKDMYDFKGWSYNGNIYQANDKITMGNEDIVFTAVWKNLYKISYVVEGKEVGNKIVEEGTNVSDLLTFDYDMPDVSKEILGWEADASDETVKSIDKDIVVTAKTATKTFTVTYKVDGKTVETFNNVPYNSVVPEYKYTPAEGYNFSGWTNVPSKVTEDVVINGTTELKKFTVTYKVDGKVVKTFDDVTYGSEVPEFEYNADKAYDFTGWTNVPEKVTDNLEINGTTEIKKFTVTYKVNGTTVETFKNVAYGSKAPEYNYTVAEGYDFSGWLNVPEEVTEDVVINGTTEIKKFTVTYKVDGSVVKIFDNVTYGSEVPGYEYEVSEGYNFSGWLKVPEKVTDNLEINGTTEIKKFTVTYKINGKIEEILYDVEYGSEVPGYEYEVPEGYNFSGWLNVPEKVTDNIEINGTIEKKTFTVTYTVDGEVVDEFTVEYGSEVPASTYEVPEGYDFSGWSNTPEKVTEDLVIVGTTELKTFKITYILNNEEYYATTAKYGEEHVMLGSPAGESENFSGWTYVTGNLQKITEDVVLVGSTTIKEFTVTYTVNGEVVDEFTVEYGSEVPASTYEVPEGYKFSGFELVTEVEDTATVKQNMIFAGTTSLIVVEEEEEDVEIDTPFVPGTTEEKDKDVDKEEPTVEETEEEEEDIEIDTPFAPGTTEEKDKDVDKEEPTVEETEEEEEEDIDLDTPFDSGVQTGDTSDYSTYVAILLIAAVGAMVVAYNKKRALN